MSFKIKGLTIAIFSFLLVGCSQVLLSNLVDMRGYRYCELLFQFDNVTEVWGTQGLNECPQLEWDKLDFESIKEVSNADSLIINSPRYFLVNSSKGMVLPKGENVLFGSVEMRKLAEVTGLKADHQSFKEIAVFRENVWIFRKGEEIYYLKNPSGETYVMQSFTTMADETLTELKLANLAETLNLPSGWSYGVEVLDFKLSVHSHGEAVVIQDNLGNTYQKIVNLEE